MNDKNNQYYKQGVEFFNDNPVYHENFNGTNESHKKLYETYTKLKTEIDYTAACYFNNGFNDAKGKFWHEKSKADDFIKEVIELCKKYEIFLNFGCGCCGAGCQHKNGYDFSFSTDKIYE